MYPGLYSIPKTFHSRCIKHLAYNMSECQEMKCNFPSAIESEEVFIFLLPYLCPVPCRSPMCQRFPQLSLPSVIFKQLITATLFNPKPKQISQIKIVVKSGDIIWTLWFKTQMCFVLKSNIYGQENLKILFFKIADLHLLPGHIFFLMEII